MKANPKFLNQPRNFWAYVRTISEKAGYTERKKGPRKGQAKVPDLVEMEKALESRGLDTSEIISSADVPTKFGKLLLDYFEYRADVLNEQVQKNLMNLEEAEAVFRKLRKKFKPSAPLPMNKQKGKKKSHAYFTGIINMLIEQYSKKHPVDYDPRKLTTVTKDNFPLRTLARRVDGAFPSTENPIAIWEIKEYYYTTTFGSRVADGVYETLLDGMELQELRENEGMHVHHYMMVDAHFTWWVQGKSYLCRMIDMIHMGLVDEVLFGSEVVDRLPDLVQSWIDVLENRS